MNKVSPIMRSQAKPHILTMIGLVDIVAVIRGNGSSKFFRLHTQ